MGICAKKLCRWYKDVLSGFDTKEEQDALHKNDVIVKDSKGCKVCLRVPILEPENMGQHMAIDEKNIAGECFTILMNRETGKIAMMASTLKTKELYEIGVKLGDACWNVRTLTRDLASNFDWLGRELFLNAEHIGDKFHIVRHALDAVQSVRVRLRQEALTLQRLEEAEHKENEKAIKLQMKKDGFNYRCKPYRPEVLSNGDTHAQLLARSRYLLFMHKETWSVTQAERAALLFKFYPTIKQAYMLICRFRNWYDRKHVGKRILYKKQQLAKWYKAVKKAAIEEVINFSAMIKRHEGVTVNYFKNGHSNAHAESLNAKIQKLLNRGSGTRNLDFFLFRVKILFA